MFAVVQRLRLPVITVLCGCLVVAAAFFFVDDATSLNMAIAIIVLSMLDLSVSEPVIGNIPVRIFGIVILSVFLFLLPAVALAWVCRRRVPDGISSLLIIGWLIVFLCLYLFYPLAEVI